MLSLEQRRTAGVYFQNNNGICSVARITEKRLETWVSRCSGRAAAPNPGTRRGVRSPPRQADPETGAAAHAILCEAKLKKHGKSPEKTLKKRAGRTKIHPARPRPAIRRSLRCETSALGKSLQLRPRNRRVDAAAQATVRRRHDTLVAHNVRELADTLSHQLRVLHNVRRV